MTQEAISNPSPSYLERVGLEFDIAVNVLTGGQLNQTVSLRSAIADRDGRKWGCFMCWFLNWAVQRNHCALQFSTGPTKPVVMIRAGIAFFVGAVALSAMTYCFHILLTHAF
jgi:hypothetical protein